MAAYATITPDLSVLKRPPPPKDKTLSLHSQSRFNQIGVQQLSSHVQSQIFCRPSSPPPQHLIELSKEHLGRHQLLGHNQEDSPPIAFDLPGLHGSTLDEHFYKLGKHASEPYYTQALEFARADLPSPPRKWVRQSGWTKYSQNGTYEAVEAPQEEMLTFDTEVMWKESSFAVMACAASTTAWYAWLSPWLLGESENDRHLVPLGSPDQARIVIGHNIGYDRARVAEEYNIRQSKNFFLDTMSLHVAVNGMCSRQRPTWIKHKKNRDMRDKFNRETNSVELQALLENKILSEEEEELWVGRSSINSLRDVAKFHCNVTIDKAQRDHFGVLDREGVRAKIDELLDYCAADVAVTHRVYKKVFPGFLEVCPHPVSFGALRHLSSVILPVNKSWLSYIENSEKTYQKLSSAVEQRLSALANRALAVKEKPDHYAKDDWFRQLDWSGQEVRMVKGKKKGDPPKPAARQKKPGMPQWYKALFATNNADIALTVRTRIAPLLLRLSWDGYPLVWSDKYGWTFKVPIAKADSYALKPVIDCDMSDEKDVELREDKSYRYFKLPHKDGPQARCTNPLAKGYLQYFESGTLTSEYGYAKEALEMNASCSYWISARDRIRSQMVVYRDDTSPVISTTSSCLTNVDSVGFILPQVIPMGTITRRAVENTWLTASNAKPNRVGSELKSMIKSPPGYCFVGADVDSEELWIASLVGDAQFRLHGGNAIGFMTLEGTKSAGTDLHSKTAKILGISRNDAKVFNYGRIYGAGLKFASTLLRQFNSNLSDKDTLEIATRLYKETKGVKTLRKALHDRSFWRGGTESFVFNRLEEFAEQERPRTPVLGAGITEALMRRYINKGAFMTSRINWAIQSSGVDYLHLLIISMDYLIRRFNIDARLVITVHDEIRYLVKEEDKYRGAMALQVSNLWTRAMFSQQMGIDDLPQSCAYFSAVDIDHVLRKEVDMDCVTPSHPAKIPHGESLTIAELLEKGKEAYLDPNAVPKSPIELHKYHYKPRSSIMAELADNEDINFLKAQISSETKELNGIIKDMQKRNASLANENPRTVKQISSRKLPVIPSYAQPQEPRLMDMPINYDGAHRVWKDFSRGKEHMAKPWIRNVSVRGVLHDNPR
ncbi:MAG: hypothetical protein Q9163_002711 [Psora crenata]